MVKEKVLTQKTSARRNGFSIGILIKESKRRFRIQTKILPKQYNSERK
jgi:hypothetical protein